MTNQKKDVRNIKSNNLNIPKRDFSKHRPRPNDPWKEPGEPNWPIHTLPVRVYVEDYRPIHQICLADNDIHMKETIHKMLKVYIAHRNSLRSKIRRFLKK